MSKTIDRIELSKLLTANACGRYNKLMLLASTIKYNHGAIGKEGIDLSQQPTA